MVSVRDTGDACGLSPLPSRERVRVRGNVDRSFVVLAPPVSPDGEALSFASPKESNQRKGDPDDCPIPAMLRKRRNEKNSLSLRQFFVLIAFFLRFSGPINGDPSSRYLIASR